MATFCKTRHRSDLSIHVFEIFARHLLHNFCHIAGSVIEAWRAKQRSFPILILTARGRWEDKVAGLEMGADAEDIGLTIHPHPTLSETVFFAAEIAEGSITDLYMPKKR